MSSDLASFSEFLVDSPALRPEAPDYFGSPADWPREDRRRSVRPVRVLLISEACGGGAGRHVLDLGAGLLARGCDVHLIDAPARTDRTFRTRLERLPALKRMSIPMRRAPHPADLRAVRQIRAYARAQGPFDVIHGHGSKGGALARLAAFGTGAAAFYTPHGVAAMDPGLGRPKRLVYHCLELALSRLSARIIAVSPEERRFCVRKGLGRKRVVMIPNGIEPIPFPTRDEARHELGIPDGMVVAGFVGRLVDQKAPDVLIEAFARVAVSNRRALLVMVGSGPLEDSMRALAQRLGIADRILWTGERDAWKVLPAFDLFVLSSRKEGLPYVVLEAMAAGLPILATDSAGVEVLVRPRRNGLVVPSGRPAALAEALGQLLSDRGRLERLGRASLERAAQFTVDCMVDRTLGEYARFALSEPRGLTDAAAGQPGGGFSQLWTDQPTGAELHPAQ